MLVNSFGLARFGGTVSLQSLTLEQMIAAMKGPGIAYAPGAAPLSMTAGNGITEYAPPAITAADPGVTGTGGGIPYVGALVGSAGAGTKAAMAVAGVAVIGAAIYYAGKRLKGRGASPAMAGYSYSGRRRRRRSHR